MIDTEALAAHIRDIRAEERERCAQVAEAMQLQPNDYSAVLVCKAIAAAIRSLE